VDELLTIAEIESRFIDEWVLVQDPETNETLDVLGGRVRCHSRNRDDIDRKMMEINPPRRLAILFTGQIPDNAAVVL